MNDILLFYLCRKWCSQHRQSYITVPFPKAQITQTDLCNTAESQLPLKISWRSTTHSVFPWIFFRLVWSAWDTHVQKHLVSVKQWGFCRGRGCSVRSFRKSMELHILKLWWIVRPGGTSRTANSAVVTLEDCVGREKPNLVHTDSWELSLRSVIHQTVKVFSLGER